MRALLLAVVALVATSCAGGDRPRTVPPDPNLPTELERARAASPPLYYAGATVVGLELTAVDVHAPGRATFSYGTCELPQGEGGCARPVQIQHFPFSNAQWRRASGCRTLGQLRGVPAARHDGLVLFTERRVVKIYARTAAEERRIALAIRPVDDTGAEDGEPLPPPAEAVRTLVERVCS